MANISFGERVRRARIRNAWTGAELGAKVNVSQATISNWETGKAAPTAEQRTTLKDVLGLARDDAKSREDGTVDDAPSTFAGLISTRQLLKNH